VPWVRRDPGLLSRQPHGERGGGRYRHRALGTWTREVDLHLATSGVARAKLIAGGLPPERVEPNFVSPDPGAGDGRGGHALYVARLSAEKNLTTLLEVWRRLRPAMPLEIVGNGPLETVVAAAADGIEIEVLGRRPIAEVYRLMGEARCLIFPSVWYERCPRVICEAFAKGTPVFAAAIGPPPRWSSRGARGCCSDRATRTTWPVG
jgi:glycosyltransferase involved in cell wall biosynthesis